MRAAFVSILTVTIASAPAVAGPEFGLRGAYAVANESGTAIGDAFNYLVPLWVDAGWRVNPNLFLGAFVAYGIGLEKDRPRTSGRDIRFGIQAQVNTSLEKRVALWAGLGVGYEFLDVTSSGMTAYGWEFLHAQAGMDISTGTPIRVGPFAAFTVGEFMRETFSGGPSFALGDQLHVYGIFGLRAVLSFD